MPPNLRLYAGDHEAESFKRAVEGQHAFFAVASVIDRMYPLAVSEGNRLFGDRPERCRMIGHIRHSMIEEECRKIPTLVGGVIATDQLYTTGNGSFLLLQIQELMVSMSCVKDENTMPREAQFRALLRRLNQWTLRESSEDGGPQRHALVIHGPMPDNWAQPAFILAAVPSPNGDRYLYTYDLRRHPGANLAASSSPTPVIPTVGVQLPQERKVTLKKKIKVQNEE